MIKTGIIEKNEVWSGEVLIRGDLTIAKDITVTVMSGSRVIYDGGNGFKNPEKEKLIRNTSIDPDALEKLAEKNFMFVEGRLVAEGKASELVSFEGGGEFGGIVVLQGGYALLDRCAISRACHGVYGQPQSVLDILNCDISENEYGLTGFGTVKIDSNTIHGNVTGIWISGFNGNNTGIWNTGYDGYQISRNIIKDNSKTGIICSSVQMLIHGNKISGNDTGINMRIYKEATIDNNEITDNRVGIYSFRSKLLKVTGNRIEGNKGVGILSHLGNCRLEVQNNMIAGSEKTIEMQELSEALIEGNTFSDSGIGLMLQKLVKAKVANNTFRNIAGTAVRCLDLSESELRDNIIDGAGTGVAALNESRLVIHATEILSRNEAVRCTDVCNVSIEGSKLTAEKEACVTLGKSAVISVRDSTLTGDVGFELIDLSTLKAENNTINCVYNGVVSSGQTDLFITGNTIVCRNSVGASAIAAYESSRLEINGNNINSENNGLMLCDNIVAEARNNKIESGRIGLQLSGTASIGMHSDSIKSRSDSALKIEYNSRCNAEGCEIEGVRGIEVEGESTMKMQSGRIQYVEYGLSIGGSSNADIKDIRVCGNKADTGMECGGLSVVKVTNVEISGTKEGIKACEEAKIELERVSIACEVSGVMMEGSSIGKITGIEVNTAKDGIRVTDQSVTDVQNFKIEGVGAGKGIECSGISEFKAKAGLITGVADGVKLLGESTVELIDTSITGMGGVDAVGSSKLKISGSTIDSREYGLRCGEQSIVSAYNLKIAGDGSEIGIDLGGIACVTMDKIEVKNAKNGIRVKDESVLDVVGADIESRNYCLSVTETGSAVVKESDFKSLAGTAAVFDRNSSGDIVNSRISGSKCVETRGESKLRLDGVEISGDGGLDAIGSSVMNIKGTKIKFGKYGLCAVEQSAIKLEDTALEGDGAEVGVDIGNISELKSEGAVIKGVKDGIRVRDESVADILRTSIESRNYCLSVTETSSAVVKESDFKSLAGTAIMLDRCSNGEITGNRIAGKKGIEALGAAAVKAGGNVIEALFVGIDAYGQVKMEIRGNVISGAQQKGSTGINAEESATAEIYDNSIVKMSTGITICDDAEVKYDNNKITADREIKFYGSVASKGAEAKKASASAGRLTFNHSFQQVVLSTRNTPVLKQIYKAAYGAAILFVKYMLRPLRSVRSMYLRRGLTYSDWIPGSSDIDLLVVIEIADDEQEEKLIQRIWQRYFLVKAVFPMLGEMHIASRKEFENYMRWGDLRAMEARSTWKILFGDRLTQDFLNDPAKLKTDVFGEMCNSLSLMCDLVFNNRRHINTDELFSKLFMDIAKCLYIYQDKKITRYGRRSDILSRCLADTNDRIIVDMITGVKNAWELGETISEAIMDKAFIYCFNRVNIVASGLLSELGGNYNSAEHESYKVCEVKKGAGIEIGLGRFEKWKKICASVSALMDGSLKGIVLDKPGLMHIITQGSAEIDQSKLSNIRIVISLLKNNMITENTPCILLTDSMFRVFIKIIHFETPFYSFSLLDSGADGVYADQSNERWQYGITSEEYAKSFMAESSLLLRETIAIISMNFRTCESASVWASKDRVVRYLNTILGARLAIEKKVVPAPYIETVMDCYAREYAEAAAEIGYFKKNFINEPAEALPADTIRCRRFLSGILESLNNKFAKETLNGSEKREFCLK